MHIIFYLLLPYSLINRNLHVILSNTAIYEYTQVQCRAKVFGHSFLTLYFKSDILQNYNYLILYDCITVFVCYARFFRLSYRYCRYYLKFCQISLFEYRNKNLFLLRKLLLETPLCLQTLLNFESHGLRSILTQKNYLNTSRTYCTTLLKYNIE